MKKLYYVLAVAAAAVLMVGCAKEDGNTNNGKKTLTIEAENDAFTKVGGTEWYGAYTGTYHNGDEMMVFSSTESGSFKYTIDTEFVEPAPGAYSSSTARFTGDIPYDAANDIFGLAAIIPYSAAIDGGIQAPTNADEVETAFSVMANFPATQEYREKGFKGMPMYARSWGNVELNTLRLSFNAMGGVIKLPIRRANDGDKTNAFSLTSIEVKALDGSDVAQKLAGQYLFMSNTKLGTFGPSSTETITLNMPTGGIALSTASATDFFFCVPAFADAYKWQFTLNFSGGQTPVTITSDITNGVAIAAQNVVYFPTVVIDKDGVFKGTELVNPTMSITPTLMTGPTFTVGTYNFEYSGFTPDPDSERVKYQGPGYIMNLDPITSGVVSVTLKGLTAGSSNLTVDFSTDAAFTAPTSTVVNASGDQKVAAPSDSNLYEYVRINKGGIVGPPAYFGSVEIEYNL